MTNVSTDQVLSVTQAAVIDSDPVAEAGSSLAVDGSVQLDGSQSYDLNNQPIVDYTWDIDGVGSRNGQIVGLSDLEPGDYTVTLTVTADDGNQHSDTMIFGIPEKANEVPPLDLMAQWSFEDVTGTTISDSIGGYSLENLGATIETGYVGNGLTTGLSGYATGGDVLDFEQDEALTVVARVKPQNDGHSTIVGKANGTGDRRGWEFLQDVNGKLAFKLTHDKYSANMIYVQTVSRLENAGWNHVTVTYDGSGDAAGVKLYLNGFEEAVTVITDALNGTTSTSHPLNVGAREGTTFARFNGSIDEIRIYGRELTGKRSQHPGAITRAATHPPHPRHRSGMKKAPPRRGFFGYWRSSTDGPPF